MQMFLTVNVQSFSSFVIPMIFHTWHLISEEERCRVISWRLPCFWGVFATAAETGHQMWGVFPSVGWGKNEGKMKPGIQVDHNRIRGRWFHLLSFTEWNGSRMWQLWTRLSITRMNHFLHVSTYYANMCKTWYIYIRTYIHNINMYINYKLLIITLHMFSKYTDCIGSMCINKYILYIYTNPVQLCHQDPGDAFDFLDVRSCGTISLREVRVKWMEKIMSVCAGGGFEKKTRGGWFWRCFILTTIYSPCFEKMLQKTAIIQCFFSWTSEGFWKWMLKGISTISAIAKSHRKGPTITCNLEMGPSKDFIILDA